VSEGSERGSGGGSAQGREAYGPTAGAVLGRWCFGRGNSAPLSLGVSTRASASLRLTPVGGRLSVTIPYEEEGVRGVSDSTQNSTVH
jgi:hypothetical protein